ncbi:hypothetical protein RhiirC2_735418 [Rhizophagus irregularis]|uniref:Uncharacterized protein n=1 Tax=Rhizophagus irregularis TaxID=588596 RepID=A0A2N1NQ23_9GLOM|nr:hypothetical protein RhiirC2_735418 [Rhizophagus irregularis]
MKIIFAVDRIGPFRIRISSKNRFTWYITACFMITVFNILWNYSLLIKKSLPKYAKGQFDALIRKGQEHL